VQDPTVSLSVRERRGAPDFLGRFDRARPTVVGGRPSSEGKEVGRGEEEGGERWSGPVGN
jgi:hypothetical protein